MRNTAKKLSLKERRRRARLWIVSGAAVLLLAVFVGAAFALRSSTVTIASVAVVGQTYTRADLVEDVVWSKLHGSYFFIIPRASAFFYPKQEIKKEIESLFVSVRSADITREGFTGLTVSITDRQPDALWCEGEEAVGACYFMDEEGVVFLRAETESSLLRFGGALSGDPLRQSYLAGSYASLSGFLKKLNGATGRTPERVFVDSNEDVSVFFKEGGVVLFTKGGVDDALLDNIASVFVSRRLKDDATLDYADFRFGNKVYVKFKGE
jgi:hypothetical protein